MGLNVAQQLIASHLVSGGMHAGSEIALRIDQTLTQDATGTLVMLELEAMGLDRVRTEVSAQYVDHNLLQTDERNPDDHLFLRSACRRFGLWYSQPGNGVSHAVHMQRLGIPGKTLVGSDSHTPAAGSLGMLAIGVGGLEVALAMAGQPLYVQMPRIWGVELVGELPEWVSAKDVILELLRRHGVKGGVGRILEYHGPGLACLSAMDRHVIANMGAELGATTSVFPSDEEVRRFLELEGRGDDWVELRADDDAEYDVQERIDLSALEPLIALPSSPGNVVPVREVEGEPIYQAYIGSSANPGLRDLAVPAMILQRGSPAGGAGVTTDGAESSAGGGGVTTDGAASPALRTYDGVSFDINPASRQTLQTLAGMGLLMPLLGAGARLHQAGCNGCIGMGQAPASGRPSLRTTPRNFPGRSGATEDAVYLCSPETATASALTGRITDPRRLPELFGVDWPRYEDPPAGRYVVNDQMLSPPLPPEEARREELVKGPNIASLPEFDPLPDRLELPVLLKVGDDVSTDEIMPAGQKVLPYRSNIPKIAEFVYIQVDETYVRRAREAGGGHALVGGDNYGQGSSREHAAIAPRHLGLRVVVAKSYARIHWQNLANFGILPLEFTDADDYERLAQGDVLHFEGLHAALEAGEEVEAGTDDGARLLLRHRLSPRQARMVLAGGLIPLQRSEAEAGGGRREVQH